MGKRSASVYGKKRFKKRKTSRKKGKNSQKKALRKLGRALSRYVQPGPITLAKKRGNVRRYLNEKRGNELACAQDVAEFTCIDCLGDYSWYNNILSASGQDGALGSVTDYNIDYHLFNQKQNYHFRNVGNHPFYFSIFECVVRKDNYIDTTVSTYDDCRVGAMNMLNQGWEKLAASGEFGSTGTIAAYTEGATSISSNMKTIGPFNSHAFTVNYKITKVSKARLVPGDDYWYSVKMPAHTVKASEWVRGDDQTRLEAKAGHTKVIIVMMRGCLGKGTADDAKSGWMTSDCAYEALTRASVVRLQEMDRAMAVSYTADDLTAVTLEAGTEHTMANEGL